MFWKSRNWSTFSEISWFWSIFFCFWIFLSAFFAIISGCGQKIWKSRFWSKFSIISILVEIVDSLDIGQKFWRISIIVKIFEKSRFWENIFIFEHLDFRQNFRKCGFWSKFSENFNSGHNFEKSRFCSKCLEILILDNVFEKSWFWQKNSANLLSAFRKIISILVKIFEHLDFG